MRSNEEIDEAIHKRLEELNLEAEFMADGRRCWVTFVDGQVVYNSPVQIRPH